jgi:hypothetical protein
MSAACNVTLSNPSTGATYLLEVIQAGSPPPYAITWVTTIKWAGGTAPTISGVNKKDLITLFYDGTDYLGSAVLFH